MISGSDLLRLASTALGILWVLGFARVTAAEPVPADDPATKQAARDLGQAGVDLLAEGKFTEAQAKLHQAYELVPVPTFAVLEARAWLGLGRLVEAAEAYQVAAHSNLGPNPPERLVQAVDEANHELDQLLPRLPGLVIRITSLPSDTAGLTVRVDDTAFPLTQLGIRRPVNPGEHEVRAVWSGGYWTSGSFTLEEGEQREILVVVTPPALASHPPPAVREVPPVPPRELGRTQRIFGWSSVGLGGVGLVTGVAAGMVMLGAKSTLDAHCTPLCPPAYRDELDQFRTARTVSWIGYGVGIAGLAAGTTLLLTARRSAKTSKAVPWVGLTSAGVAGRF